MNSVNINLQGHCNKLVNLHNYIHTNVDHFQTKLCKFYTFFYYTWTDVNAYKASKTSNKTNRH